MNKLSRRSVLQASVGIAAGAALSRPYIANAQAKTAVCWINQGFVPEEDAAMVKVCEDYMKASGNKLDYSIMPFMAQNQKTISALTSGDVPDMVFMDAPSSILPQNAWDDKILDVSDVVAEFEPKLSDTAKLGSTFYNKATKKRSYYLCPIKQGATPFHIWGDLVEKAGLKMSELPKNWDGVWTYLAQAQKPLRAKGMRHVYALGMQITTVGPNDGNNVFTHFLIANGGEGIITPDGKLHTDDPKIREAAIKSVEFMTDRYKEGLVPPEALSWNDADDNNGFHEKLFVMDFDGTLSTELAMFKDKQAFLHDMVTLAPVNKNDGTPMKTQVNAGGGFIPKGAKGVEVAKDFMKYFMQPKVMNENLKGGLGRWVPAIPQVVKDDPWWLNSGEPCLKPYVEEAVLNPTLPVFEGYSPAWGQANAEQLWGQAHADVIKNGMKVADAVDKAFKRCNEIFAKVIM
ncbi:MAG TPA: ABC transporter substrate-binding protein [Acetobacteraceae bacterium]|jgi:multiple sugar transport system substrate-binding protein|nr:ABC transporter substrate-binding protein [Acetobacteraceae bacterium]HTB42663.1 ABC transporter substrate-binding protein [Acetobacteraceae bacterium]